MLYLTQAEIDDLCAPLSQAAAQVRYLRSLGLTVHTKPNGRPVVIRSHAELVLSGRRTADPAPAADVPASAPAQQPNRAALVSLFAAGRKHGPPPKAQPA